MKIAVNVENQTLCFTGSRSIPNGGTARLRVHLILLAHNPGRVVVGDAGGCDQVVADYCATSEKMYPVKVYPADWDKHGKSAGPIRDAEMVGAADIVVALWDGVSRGTKHTIGEALRQQKELHVYYWEGQTND